MNRRRLIDGILYVIVYLCAGFSVLLLLGIIGRFREELVLLI